MNISLNEELVKIVNLAIKQGAYANRSEFFRDLIRRNYILKPEQPDGSIDEVLPGDPDYHIFEERDTDDAEFVEADQIFDV